MKKISLVIIFIFLSADAVFAAKINQYTTANDIYIKVKKVNGKCKTKCLRKRKHKSKKMPANPPIITYPQQNITKIKSVEKNNNEPAPTIIISETNITTFINKTNNDLYVGINFGAAWNDISSPAASARLYVGYVIDSLWAIEFGTTGTAQSGGVPNENMEYYDVSIRMSLPINEDYSFITQFGGAYGSPGKLGGNDSNLSLQPHINQGGWNMLAVMGFEKEMYKNAYINLLDYYYCCAKNPQGITDSLLLGLRYKF